MSRPTSVKRTQTFSIDLKGGSVTFTSTYTDAQALHLLDVMVSEGRSDHPAAPDLVRRGKRLWGQMADEDRAWVHKIVLDTLAAERHRGDRPATAHSGYRPLIELFDRAAKRVKSPGASMTLNGQPLNVRRADDDSPNPSGLYVTGPRLDGGKGTYYGKITSDGVLHPSNLFVPEIGTLLDLLTVDPAKLAAAYGRRSGKCCFCSRHLQATLDGHSVTVGYDPDCAATFGLPWGASSATRKRLTPEALARMGDEAPTSARVARGTPRTPGRGKADPARDDARRIGTNLVEAFGLEAARGTVGDILSTLMTGSDGAKRWTMVREYLDTIGPRVAGPVAGVARPVDRVVPARPV